MQIRYANSIGRDERPFSWSHKVVWALFTLKELASGFNSEKAFELLRERLKL